MKHYRRNYQKIISRTKPKIEKKKQIGFYGFHW